MVCVTVIANQKHLPSSFPAHPPGPTDLRSDALADIAQWLGSQPVHRRVMGTLASQSMYMGCRFDPQRGWGRVRMANNQCVFLTSMLLTLFLLSLFSSLSRTQWKISSGEESQQQKMPLQS